MLNNTGLTNKEVNISRNKYGSNSINGKNKSTFISLFIETIGDPIIKILLIALFIKVIFLFKDFDYFETIGIVVAILVASLISAVSEYGSNKAFQRMQEESSRINVLVKRDGKTKEITIDEIVKNDILILAPGNKVPADGILIKGKLSVDESSLNGETKEVYKEYIDNIKDLDNIENITIHLEIEKNIKEILSKIKSLGFKRGLSIKPNTDINKLVPYLDDIDLILVMTVEPGLGGQQFLESSTKRLKEIKELIGTRDILLEVDGGINNNTINLVKDANIVVVGSYITKSTDQVSQINSLLV